MDPLYKPHGVEKRWQRTWEAERLYHADVDAPGETCVIAVPPPNVTGALHMGHALNGSIQDALVRWKRMQGYNTLWQPGFDHAGIATQAVVEKELRRQGISRQEIGRCGGVDFAGNALERRLRKIELNDTDRSGNIPSGA